MGNMVKSSIFARQVWNSIENYQYDYVYFDGRYKYGQAAYENQQGILGSEWQHGVYDKDGQDITQGIQLTIQNFHQKKDEAENTEIQLLNDMDYPNLFNYKGMSNSEKISLWTKVILFGGQETRLWDVNNSDDVRIAFALFINSTEFIKEYRGTAIYSAMYSGRYGKVTGAENKEAARKEFMEMIMNTKDNNYKMLRKEIVSSMKEYFKGVNIGDIEKLVSKTLLSIRKDSIMKLEVKSVEQTDSIKKVESAETLIYEKKKEKIKEYFELMVQNSIAKLEKRERSRNITEEERQDIQNWRERVQEDGVFKKMNISMKGNGTDQVIFSIAAQVNTSKTYKTRKGASAGEKRYSFLMAIKKVYDILKNSELTFGFIKHLKVANTDFWQCVQRYIGDGFSVEGSLLQQTTRQIFGENCKFFNQDWNASAMTGMLGELSAYLTHSSSLENLSLSGTTIDRLTHQGTSLSMGESFKDLTFIFNSKKYGINVKRYTTQEKDNFTLYEDSEGVGINSQYIYRYFTPNQVKLMRFIALNRDFIVENLAAYSADQADNLITDLYQSLSVCQLDNFVRLSSAISGTINLFYAINNLTIPASVIYNYIITTLKDLQSAKDLFIISINKTPKAKTEKLIKGEMKDDLPEEVEKSNNRLQGSIKIKFKGLTLNNLGSLL